MSDPRRILVRGPNWTGDLVMATPGFRALRAAHPEAHITLQLRPGLEALMEGAPWFDRILPLRSYHKGVAALLREAAELRSESFDVGLCLPDSFSSALLMRAAGVRRVVGYRRGVRGALLHQRVAPAESWGPRRMVARERFVLGLTEAIGCPSLGTALELYTSEAEEREGERVLGAAGVVEGEPLVALAPGASYGPSKLWPAGHFARVGDALAHEGLRVLVVGAPAEAPLAHRLRAAMREPVVDLCGKLGLGSLKAVLRRCALLVCNDAGARHVAVAFGVPCVVIFGPTDLAKTNLNLEGVRSLESEVRCRPCYLRECPIDHRCMTGIAPERAIDAALSMLARSAPGQRFDRVC